MISHAKSSSSVRYLLYDGHGSTRALVSSEGTIAIDDPKATPTTTSDDVVQTFDYDAYGNLLNMPATDATTPLLYSGEWTDAQTGQQYLRARYYDPATGRFNRLDEFAGSDRDPQSLHKYLYASADPMTFVDPTGHFFGGSFVSTLGALSIQGLIRGTQIGAVGAAGGALFGALDAGLAGEDILNGALNGPKWGGGIGIGLGFLAPFATTFLSGSTLSFIGNLGAGASVTFGALGAIDSFGDGNQLQGIFRLGTSFLGAYALRRGPIRPNRPVNIGGEGAIPNVMNLQPRSALTRGYGRSQPTASGQPPGRSLAGMILEGHDFQIYNAATGKLPYASGSVPRVYTNEVPIDTPPGGLFPPIRSDEIKRILQPGGQWIRDGRVFFTKS